MNEKSEIFNHPGFTKINFDDISVDEELLLVSDKLMLKLEKVWINFFEKTVTGDVPYKKTISSEARCFSRTEDLLHIEIKINGMTRFHSVQQVIKREDFVACVEMRETGDGPFLFLKDEWISNISCLNFCIFGCFDAIGMKDYLEKNGKIDINLILLLERKIDAIAKDFSDFEFLSFSDSVMIVSRYQSRPWGYRYLPELTIKIFEKINAAFNETLGLNINGILAQGENQYITAKRFKKKKNHLSLRVLGSAFKSIFDIENAYKGNVKKGVHDYADLYIEQSLFHSMHWRFDKSERCERRSYLYDENFRYFPVSHQKICNEINWDKVDVEHRRSEFQYLILEVKKIFRLARIRLLG